MSATPDPIARLMKRCQIGVGGPNALDDAHDIMAECYGTLGKLSADLAQMTRERDALRGEVERERMRLAACGVVALANTPETAAEARKMHADYQSASCDDVARMVDSEMRLRAEVERIRDIVTLYFMPWGAAKAAMWEGAVGDVGFTAENALTALSAALQEPTP